MAFAPSLKPTPGSDRDLSLPVMWEANPGPQAKFLSCSAFETLTGGARGGGKSEGLIMDALWGVDIPEYRAIFFRLSYPDLLPLIERTMVRYKGIYPDCKWNQTEKSWTFPSGAKILFRFLKHENDWIHYQGHEYHWMGFEELTQFTEAQYINLLPSCRSGSPSIPGSECRVRSTCNPGGRGHNWVKARFVDPFPAGGRVIVEPMRDPTNGEMRYSTRAFFPSTFRDNPQLLANDPEYVLRLMLLPEADRKAMMNGDWNAFIGSVFRFSTGITLWSWADFEKRTGSKKIPKHWRKYRVMDWGYAAPFSIQWFAVNEDNVAFLYREWYGVKVNASGKVIENQGIRMVPEEVAKRIRKIEKAAGEWDDDSDRSSNICVADPACWNRGTGDHEGGPSVVEQMQRQGVSWTKGKNDRLSGKMAVHDRLQYEMNEEKTRVLVPPGLVIIVEEAPHTLRTVPALEYDPHDVEDVDTTMEDHAYDSLRYFCMARPYAPNKIIEARKGRMNPEKEESAWVV